MSDTHLSNAHALRPHLQSNTGSQVPDYAQRLEHTLSGNGRVSLRAEPTWDDGSLSTPDSADTRQGAVPGGRGGASGGGGANGHTLRTARGRDDATRPNFNLAVPPNGYAWWYVDGIKLGGGRAISIIGFIGSVFSPWYAWSGRTNPENHVCINVATYGPGGRFTMTDRGQSALRQSRDELRIGPSSMRWQDGQLIIEVDEIGALPMVTPVRGCITVTPHAMTGVELPLTPDGSHVWRPFAPSCDIRVDLNGRGWQWDGHGYFDANFGTRALEQDFNTWTWGRFPLADDSAVCFYDAQRKDGSTLGVGVQINADGHAREIDPPPKARLKRSLWALARETRADTGYQPRQVQAMLDAPFYNRAAVRTQINGEETTGVYEALDLRRYGSSLLKPMIAVRVSRRANWRFG